MMLGEMTYYGGDFWNLESGQYHFGVGGTCVLGALDRSDFVMRANRGLAVLLGNKAIKLLAAQGCKAASCSPSKSLPMPTHHHWQLGKSWSITRCDNNDPDIADARAELAAGGRFQVSPWRQFDVRANSSFRFRECAGRSRR